MGARIFEKPEVDKELPAKEMEEKSDILKRYESLRTARVPWEQAWQSVSAYLSSFLIQPANTRSRTNGDDKLYLNAELYSGAAVHAVDLFANGFIGNLCPRGTPWFALKLHDDKMAQDQFIKEWYSDLETHFYDRFDQSNFYESIYAVTKLASSYGTSAFFIRGNDATKQLFFHVLPMNSFWVDEDQNGQVDTLYRELWMQGRNILKQFPDIDTKPSGKQVAMELKERQYQYFRLIHAVQPREEFDPNDAGNKNFPYESIYYIDGWDNFELSCSGFKTFPYAVWRFRKEPGYTYGFGPGLDSLRDGEILQQVSKTMLEADHMAVRPPWLLPEGMRTNDDELQLFPEGRNYYDGLNPQSIRPLSTGTPVIGHQREEQLKQAIRDHFFVDFMLMLQQAQRQMTAQEVIERQAEKAAVLSTIIGRFNSELMDVVFQRIFEIDFEYGLLPPLPVDISVEKINIDYMGPLAMAQKMYHRNMGVQRFLGQVLPLAQAFPDILDRIDSDAMVDDAADSNNLNPKILVPLAKALKLRQQKAAAQQAAVTNQAQQQALQQAAEFSQKAGTAPEPGSLAQMMMNSGRTSQ